MCYFNPSSAGQVSIEVKFLFQLQGLIPGVSSPSPFPFWSPYVVMTYVQLSHPRVDLGLGRLCCALVARGTCLLAARRSVFLGAGRGANPVPADVRAAAGIGRSAAGVAQGVFHPVVTLADGRSGHGGAGQGIGGRRVGSGRGLAVPGLCRGRGAVGRVGAGSLAGTKVGGSGAPDAEVHAIVAVSVPAGVHAGGVPVLLAHRAVISIIM